MYVALERSTRFPSLSSLLCINAVTVQYYFVNAYVALAIQTDIIFSSTVTASVTYQKLSFHASLSTRT
jgi:hypothetical protein